MTVIPPPMVLINLVGLMSLRLGTAITAPTSEGLTKCDDDHKTVHLVANHDGYLYYLSPIFMAMDLVVVV